jgi:hypothetical protein
MAKGSFKFQLAKECHIRGSDVVGVGKLVLKIRAGYRGEVKLGNRLVECGKLGVGHLTMEDIGLLDMIIHGAEEFPFYSGVNDKVIQDANDLIEVARKFADMDYQDFDIASKNDNIIYRRRAALVAD